MKYFLISIIILLSTCIISSKALDTKFIDYKFNTTGYGIIDYDVYKGKIAFFGVEADEPGYSFKPEIIVLENGQWKKLPNYIGTDTTNRLFPADNSQIHFDSSGNIWVCGYLLYKYDGNQWSEYHIDGDAYFNKRHFEQFCIDKYNNIWITSFIRLSTSENYGEFFKFDGSKFTSVQWFPYAYTLAGYGEFMNSYVLSAMPEGRVILHRLFNKFEDGFDNGQYKDVSIYNQDMTSQKLRLPSASTSPTSASYTKVVEMILPESDGKIWFPLGIYSWGSDFSESGSCCSGLTLYDNGTWTVFNKSHGLDSLREDLYEPIYRIAKLSNGSYFLIGRNCYYIMDSKLIIKKFFWEDYFNKSEFIVYSSYFNGEKGYEFLSNYLPYPPINSSNLGMRSVFVKDNNIYIGMDRGVMITKESDLLSIAGIEETTDNTALLYPNPANDQININPNLNYTSYQIMNVIGQVVISGNYSAGSISILGLPSGVYFIKLNRFNQAFTLTNFIKE